MDSAMCSIGQTMPNSFLGGTQDTDSIKSCAMTDMFSHRPRNKRKDFYPNGIMRMPDEAAAELSNDEMNSEGESDPDSPIPMNVVKDEASFQDNGMDLTPQRHQEADQRIKYADTANDFPGLNGLKMPPAFPTAMDFQQQQQQLQYHLQQLQQQTQENQRQFQQQIQQQIEHQHQQMKQQHNMPLNIKTEPGIMTPNHNGLNLSSPTAVPMNGYPSMHAVAPPTQHSPQNHQKLQQQQNNNMNSSSSGGVAGGMVGGDIPIDFSTSTAQIKQEKLDAQDSLDMRAAAYGGAYPNGAMTTTDIHTNEPIHDYMCRHCRRPFKSQINLDRHMEKAHNPKNSKIFTCLLCPYTTKFYSNMYVHIRTHTGDKPYWCGACGASFSQGSSLKIHIISKHGGNKKYFILDRKLGKANLLRFWQRRDSGSHASDERDIKPDINALNAMMTAGDLANKGLIHNNNTDSVDGHMPNPNMNPAFMGAQNQLGNFGMLPNGMNMLNPMMNPLGLNLLTQNPLAAPNLMMGGMNLNGMNGNMFIPPQGLLNGLNLKNSAFFTKTTKFDLEHVRNNENKPPLTKQPIINGNAGADNKNILNNLNVQPDNNLIPNMNAILQGQAKLGLDIPPSDFRKVMNNNHQQQLSSPSEPENLSVSHASPISSRHNTPSPTPKINMTGSPKPTPSPSHLHNEQQQQQQRPLQRESSPATVTVSPNSASTGSLHHNHSHNTSTSSDSSQDSKKSGSSAGPADDCPYEQKLKDLRKNVVRMLHMMLPDLPMDKEMNRESEDVDLMLMDVIRSTVTDIGEQ